MNSEQVLRELKTDLPPDILYTQEICWKFQQLYFALKDCLALNGLDYCPHPQSNRRSHGTLDTLYSYEYNSSRAKSMLDSDLMSSRDNLVVSMGEGGTEPPATYNSHQDSYYKERSIANQVCNWFRTEDRFCGKMGQDIGEEIMNYNDGCSDLTIPDMKRVKTFHIVFGK